MGIDFLNEPFPGSVSNQVIKSLLSSAVKVAFTSRNISRTKLLGDLIIKDRHKYILDNFNARVFAELVLGAAPVLNKFDVEKYNPFLNKMGAAVREVNNNLILFVDNSYYCNLGIPCLAGPIMVKGEKDKLQCFAPHGYDFGVDTPLYKYASNERIKFIFDEHRRTQERLGIPVIVGEWAAPPRATSGSSTQNTSSICSISTSGATPIGYSSPNCPTQSSPKPCSKEHIQLR